jgi:hypothetical protein
MEPAQVRAQESAEFLSEAVRRLRFGGEIHTLEQNGKSAVISGCWMAGRVGVFEIIIRPCANFACEPPTASASAN